MKKQITHMSVHQCSKVLALMIFVFTALIVVPVGLIGFAFTRDASNFAVFLLPFIALVIYYIIFAIHFWVYNLVASSFGGLEFDLEDKI